MATEDYREISGTPTTGVFSTEASRSVSLIEGAPYKGWTTIAFSDQNDTIGLNDQLVYVPTKLFDAAIKKYQDGKQGK